MCGGGGGGGGEGVGSRGQTQDFSVGVTFVMGVTIHCRITKICELGACILYFSCVFT